MSKQVVLGGAVKAIREAKAATDDRFKQARFSIACGMTPGHLCNIEAGRRPATQALIHTIAKELGVPIGAISYAMPEEAAA